MSKLGPHMMAGGNVLPWRDAEAVIFKFDPMTLGMSELIPPGPIVVGKLDQQDNSIGITDWKAMMKQGASPSDSARHRFEAQRAVPGPQGTRVNRYAANPRIDVWEDDNEVVPDNPDEARWYAMYCVEMMKRYENIGKRRANFSFAVGTPNITPDNPSDIWPLLLPAVRHARNHGHYIALHEYMGYKADFGVGWKQINHLRQPLHSWWGRYKVSTPDESYPYGWTVLRYRAIWDKYLLRVGLNDTKLIITELGCDSVESVTPVGYPTGTWREMSNTWQDNGLDPEQHYADMLAWYDSRISEDRYVVGATIFTVGSVGIWSKWDIADTEVESTILNHIRATAGSVPPEPEEPEQPDPEEPVSTANILKNPSFDKEGWADHSWGQEPPDWVLNWKVSGEGGTPQAHDGFPYVVGEARLLSRAYLPPSEHDTFFLDPNDAGDGLTFKVFGGNKAIWANLKQEVEARPGRYRLTVPVYIDHYRWDEVNKRKDFNVEPDQAEMRIRVAERDALAWTPLTTNQRHNVIVEFDHGGGVIDLSIQFRSNWPISGNFWLDGLSLVEVPAAEIPTPVPPPVRRHTAVVVKIPQGATQIEWLAAATFAHAFQHTLTASVDDAITILNGGDPATSNIKILWPSNPGHEDMVERAQAGGYRITNYDIPKEVRTSIFTAPVGDEDERESGQLW